MQNDVFSFRCEWIHRLPVSSCCHGDTAIFRERGVTGWIPWETPPRLNPTTHFQRQPRTKLSVGVSLADFMEMNGQAFSRTAGICQAVNLPHSPLCHSTGHIMQRGRVHREPRHAPLLASAWAQRTHGRPIPTQTNSRRRGRAYGRPWGIDGD